MAIDTAAKRASALGAGKVYLMPVIPDGTLDTDDRLTLNHLYRGIAASITFVAELTTASFAMVAEDLVWSIAPVWQLSTASFSMSAQPFDVQFAWTDILKGSAESYSNIAKGGSESYSDIPKGGDETWTDIPKGKSP